MMDNVSSCRQLIAFLFLKFELFVLSGHFRGPRSKRHISAAMLRHDFPINEPTGQTEYLIWMFEGSFFRIEVS